MAIHMVARGCSLFFLGPSPGEFRSLPTTVHPQYLRFVDMGFGRTLIPYFVPTSILVDGSGRVAWASVGAMSKRAANQAEAVQLGR